MFQFALFAAVCAIFPLAARGSGGDPLSADTIAELARRSDRTVRPQVVSLFERGLPAGERLSADAHDGTALSSAASVMLAAAQYIAVVDGAAFFPKLIRRPEALSAPHLFVPAVRRMGEGWIRAAAECCRDERCRVAAGYFIRAASTSANAAEIDTVLAGDSAFWRDAVAACERLNTAGCWAAMDASLASRTASDRLTARMAQWRMGKASAAGLLAAAEGVARQAEHEPPGDERVRLLNQLDAFRRLAEWTHLR